MDKMHVFRKALETLSNAAYCSITPAHPYISLDRNRYQVSAYLPEESISNRLACIQRAENRLHEYYSEASNQFASYSDPLSADGFLMRFKCYFITRLTELKEQLEGCRAQDNAAEIDAILNVLVPDAVFKRAEEIHEALNKRYTLPQENIYKRLISYEKYDPSEHESNPAGKLVAKIFVRYGFDLLNAIHRLEADATKILRQYKNAFDAQIALEIERFVIRPVLSELQNISSKAFEEVDIHA